MSSALFLSIAALEYIDVTRPLASLLNDAALDANLDPVLPGVPEAEVLERIAAARAEERSLVEERLHREAAQRETRLREGLQAALDRFVLERSAYFAKVEGEIVQLTLAIARKILQREAQLDPMLLAGLVRVALDGMQGGPAVTLRVAPTQVAAWKNLGDRLGVRQQPEVVADSSLAEDECLIETPVGSAQLSFERQLKEVERGFLDLLGQRPDRVL